MSDGCHGFAFFNTWGSTVYMPKNVTNSAGESVPNPQADVARKTAPRPQRSVLAWRGTPMREDFLWSQCRRDVTLWLSTSTLARLKVEINASAFTVGARFGFMYQSPDSDGLSAACSEASHETELLRGCRF